MASADTPRHWCRCSAAPVAAARFRAVSGRGPHAARRWASATCSCIPATTTGRRAPPVCPIARSRALSSLRSDREGSGAARGDRVRARAVDPRRTNDARSLPIDSRELTASASESRGPLPNLFDGDPDTRWIAGHRRPGRLELGAGAAARTRPTSRAWISQIAERSIGDYPRMLRIEGEDAAGQTHAL